MMGRWTLLVGFSFACAACGMGLFQTPWEKRQQQVEELRAAGNYRDAVQVQTWLVQNAFFSGPKGEQGREWDADRLIVLGDLAGKVGDTQAALEAYRDALMLDPRRIEDVLVGIDLLPLPAPQRDTYMDMFVQNAVSMNPQLRARTQDGDTCWGYRAEQIHVRRVITRKGAEGLEREISYDSRYWRFDDRARAWKPDGDWVYDAGAEILHLNGAPNPRFEAIVAADGAFFCADTIPPCHLSDWSGPYDQKRRNLYVTKQLPAR